MSATPAGDDADDYVRQRAAPPGSTLHYCCLFATPSQARRSIALEALLRELAAVVDECREPAVAQARLGFWQEELTRLGAGQPQHPVTRVLAEALDGGEAVTRRLAPALAATAAATRRESWASEAELADYCAATGGELAALACDAPPVTEAADHPARRLGALLCRQDMLSGLFAQPRRGAQVLAETRLREHGVKLADLFADPAPEQADRLLRDEATRLRDELLGAFRVMPRDGEGERLLRARAAVGVATLQSVSRGGAVWLSRHASVSPLRKLWIAWRHRH